MKNFWLEKAENKLEDLKLQVLAQNPQIMGVGIADIERSIEKILDNYVVWHLDSCGHTILTTKPTNKHFVYEINDEKIIVNGSVFDSSLCCSITISFNMSMKEFQEELKRIEAENCRVAQLVKIKDDTIIVDTGHSHISMNYASLQKESERVEAEGWVLDY